MKVFVVEITWSIDFDFGSTVKAFSNYESAKAELEREFAQSKIDLEHHDIVVERSDNIFSVYEDGCYSENHIDGEIIETEVLD